MKRGWLIYRKEDAVRNQDYIDWMKEEAILQGLSLELLYREELDIGITHGSYGIWRNGCRLELPDFAINRTVDPFFSFHMENMQIQVFNSSEISRICNDKALTYQYIQQMGIPVIDSLFYQKKDLPIAPPLPLPVVVKETGGRGGENVHLIHNQKDWEMAMQKLSQTSIIVQSADVQLGKDLRVFVVGQEVVAAVLRKNNHDFRANYKLGGNASLYQLTEKESAAVQKIIRRFPFGMVGIDFLIGKQGNLLFNEIEDAVGSRTLSKVEGPNIVQRYMKFIRQKL
ncbi:RimK family alpha-L-glutamate ligase [Virgibacillus xinjiangensis]|uniref:RimK family alpha-L-glutamate ligase n=1 Tax=Virgibacillus xinjiangensis TaxID=393090 RepID=A0ABV7CU82_9BACI